MSVGILIDTFVVRTILDPALASFFGRWTWWPGGVAPAPVSEAEPTRRISVTNHKEHLSWILEALTKPRTWKG